MSETVFDPGLQPERIRPILDVALARFQQDQALRLELAQAQSDLSDLSAEMNAVRMETGC